MSEVTKQCPFCAETIQAAAVVCRYCGRDLAPAAPELPRIVANGQGGYTCSVCGGGVRRDATSCKHCQTVFGVPVMGQQSSGPRRLATPSGPQCSVCQVSVAPGASSCPNCKAVFGNAPAPADAVPVRKGVHPFLIVCGIIAVVILLTVVAGTARPRAASPSPSAPVSSANPFTAFIMCKQFVGDRLKAPATAVFPTYGDEGTQTDTLSTVQFRARAFVDSQNGFGANIRTRYTCTVTNTGGDNWKLDSLTTDP